jgi:hypothetical protein
MSIIGNTYLNLADMFKRQAPDNKVAAIIDVMSKSNPVLDDAIAVEGNLPTGHRTTIRTGLPNVTWRKLYQGVQPSKSTTKQVDDACGMLEAYAEIDKALADLNGNSSAFRLSEDAAFIEAMNQEMATTLFYGDNTASPEKFMGLSARFSDMSAENGGQIIDAGGSGSDNTSIWVITWDERTAHLIYPKGSQGGLKVDNRGQVTLQDESGNNFEGYRSHYKWDVGLSVRDWRYISRIANIDVSDLATYGEETDNSANLVDLMIEALNKIQDPQKGQTAIYCNRTVKTVLDKMAASQSNRAVSTNIMDGKPVTSFYGYPVRLCDALVNNESTVA